MQLQISVTRTDNLNSIFFAEECFKLCQYWRQTNVKGGLKHKKRQDVAKLNRRHYNFLKVMFNTWILRNIVGFKKDIKKHGFIFH